MRSADRLNDPEFLSSAGSGQERTFAGRASSSEATKLPGGKYLSGYPLGHQRLIKGISLALAGRGCQLSPKFTLYGQLDSDFRVLPPVASFGDQTFVVPTGALGVGARYYYNQAGRIRQNRPHGPFVGNYLALETHTEVRQHYGTSTEFSPGLNLIWGMQRRLSRNFLFDFNTGIGLGPYSGNKGIGYNIPGSPNITTQFNLGIYFGR